MPEALLFSTRLGNTRKLDAGIWYWSVKDMNDGNRRRETLLISDTEIQIRLVSRTGRPAISAAPHFQYLAGTLTITPADTRNW